MRVRRLLGLSGAVLVAALAVAGVWLGWRLRASLPVLDGDVTLAGLSAPSRVDVDALGIPTVTGASRADVARVTGFLHAQDRYFQMDLARRRAAGELAELVGPAALDADKTARVHRLRAVAVRAARLLPPPDRAVLRAYVDGVNAGLSALGAAPPEYLLLRQTPKRWVEADSMLVILSMFLAQQDSEGAYESMLTTLRDTLPPAMAAFLTPKGTSWDTPVVGEAFQMPPMPGADVYNPRAAARRTPPVPATPAAPGAATGTPHTALPPTWGDVFAALGGSNAGGRGESGNEGFGSNNFAVSGAHTANGRALIADDMHLAVRVPNTWYRMALEWTDADVPEGRHRLDGVTLPGVPTLVAGSNRHIAWGFTTTFGDWSDVVLVERDAADGSRYRTPEGLQPFEHFEEVIAVAGRAPVRLPVDWTIWGPLLPPDHRGRDRAIRWAGHDAEQIATTMLPMETARTLGEGLDSAGWAGAPAFNQIIASDDGRIAWTIYGGMPRRDGVDGQVPSSWADGSRRWRGYLAPEAHPRIVDPPDGRLWTANARVVDGAMLEAIGDGSYEIGSRARIIRDRLRAADRVTVPDLLAIQLDDSALFLERWRALLLRVLASPAGQGDAKRAVIREIVEKNWTGHAAPDSVAYRYTRAFRDRVSRSVFDFLTAPARAADARFDYTLERKREGALWALVTEQPLHLLDPAYPSWDAFLVAAVDQVIADTEQHFGADLRARPWRELNPTRYYHPLGAAVPGLGRWLNMPATDLPGDLYTPRMAYRSDSASERFVVSPGHEAEGVMHMPTGQSGHFLSPHYADSHPAWVRGEATPFLPGTAAHTRTFHP